MIGEELWHFFNSALANFQLQATSEAKSITAIIEKTMGLITIDGDGKRILDYLGPAIVELAGSKQEFRERMLKPIYDFVLAEQERINKGSDLKLIARYKAFRHYIESRLPLWDFDEVKT